MTITRTSHRHVLLIGALGVVCALSLFAGAPRAHAASLPVTGYAWSSFLGWLHMGGSGYGVYEDSSTGILSGYAWSPTYGWVTFNQSELTGCPSGSCVAQVSGSSVTGWARSCAAFSNKNACSGSLDSNSGGWDGWIHLSGSGYGITSTHGCWSGYAWGSQDIGYINFDGTATDGSTYSVGDSTCGKAPDLTAGATSGSPSSGTVNQSTTFTGTVSNAGTLDASSFPNIIQIANSDASATVAMVAADTVSTLANGGSTTVSASYVFSSPGTYQVRTCANFNTSWGGSVYESNSSNNCGAWLSYVVDYPAVTGSCSVSPSSGKIGDTFTWTANAGGGNGSFTYSWTGDEGLSGSSRSVTAQYASAGSKAASVTITSGSSSRDFTCNTSATVYPLPTISISTSPSTVDTGQNTTLSWSSTGAASCTATGGYSTGNATSGSVSVGPNTVNPTVYGITCTGSGGSVTQYTNVAVLFPEVSITASPTRVVVGGTSTISWSATGVSSCSITGPGGFSRTGLTGSASVTASTQGTYLATCQTNGNPVTSQVIVDVLPSFTEF